MRIARIGTGLILVMFCICLYAEMPAQKITVTGKLTRVMAIGGESTGWTIQLESETTIEGKKVDSIEIDYPNTGKLEKLVNNHVKVTGIVSHRQGVETGERPILVVSSIKEVKTITQPVPAKMVPFSLSGNEWLLKI